MVRVSYPLTSIGSLRVSVDGWNNQSYEAAGGEANLDTQFAFGLTYPTPATLYSTGGSPPFTPDAVTPTNDNEPYANVCFAPCTLLQICLSSIVVDYSGWTTCYLKNISLRRSPPVTPTMSRRVLGFITQLAYTDHC